MLQEFEVKDYLYKVEELMERENKNADIWLHGRTKEEMQKTFVEEFIRKGSKELKDKEGGYFINHFMKMDRSLLTQLYNVLNYDAENCHKFIQDGLEKYVDERGKKIT